MNKMLRAYIPDNSISQQLKKIRLPKASNSRIEVLAHPKDMNYTTEAINKRINSQPDDLNANSFDNIR
jgi:hypothetical protein